MAATRSWLSLQGPQIWLYIRLSTATARELIKGARATRSRANRASALSERG